jgi:8-oxo-dGTP diphosphatase
MKHIEVVAAVIVRDGRAFCARRGGSGELAGKWEFPGGKVESGETREEALVREIAEELSVRIEAGPFLATVEHRYRDFELTLHAYEARLVEGEPALSEHLEGRWLSKHELGGLDWSAADLRLLAKASELLP